MKTKNCTPNMLNSWFDKSPKKPKNYDITKNRLWLYYKDALEFIKFLKEYNIEIIQTFIYKAKKCSELNLSYDLWEKIDYEIVKSRLRNSNIHDKNLIFMYEKFLLLDTFTHAGYIVLFAVIPNLSSNYFDSVCDMLNSWFEKSPKKTEICDITKRELWLYYEDGLEYLNFLENHNIEILGCEALLFYPDKQSVEPNQYHDFSLEDYPLTSKNLIWYPNKEKNKYDTCRNFFYDRFEIVKELRKIGYDMLFQTELDLSIAKID